MKTLNHADFGDIQCFGNLKAMRSITLTSPDLIVLANERYKQLRFTTENRASPFAVLFPPSHRILNGRSNRPDW